MHNFLPFLYVPSGLHQPAVCSTGALLPNVTGVAGFAYPYKYVFCVAITLFSASFVLTIFATPKNCPGGLIFNV